MQSFLSYANANKEDIIEAIRQMVECESPSDSPGHVNRFVDLLVEQILPVWQTSQARLQDGRAGQSGPDSGVRPLRYGLAFRNFERNAIPALQRSTLGAGSARHESGPSILYPCGSVDA